MIYKDPHSQEGIQDCKRGPGCWVQWTQVTGARRDTVQGFEIGRWLWSHLEEKRPHSFAESSFSVFRIHSVFSGYTVTTVSLYFPVRHSPSRLRKSWCPLSVSRVAFLIVFEQMPKWCKFDHVISLSSPDFPSYHLLWLFDLLLISLSGWTLPILSLCHSLPSLKVLALLKSFQPLKHALFSLSPCTCYINLLKMYSLSLTLCRVLGDLKKD